MVTEFLNKYIRIIDGQKLTIGNLTWLAISDFGHSSEHISLYNEEKSLLISGDMILPKIITHIGVYPDEPDGNPLDAFLKSLLKFKFLSKEALVLPSHAEPFGGSLQGRIMDRIKQFHQMDLYPFSHFQYLHFYYHLLV